MTPSRQDYAIVEADAVTENQTRNIAMKYIIAIVVAAGIGLPGCATPDAAHPMAAANREAAKERVAEQVLSVLRLPYYPILIAFGISPSEGITEEPKSHV